MKIISKFKDYYDGIQAHDRDDSLIYLRENTEVQARTGEYCAAYFQDQLKKITPLMDIYKRMPSSPGAGLGCGIIGFCGKFYPFYIADRGGLCFYTFDAVLSYVESINSAEFKYWEGPSKKTILENMETPPRSTKKIKVYAAISEHVGSLNRHSWTKFLEECSKIKLNDKMFRDMNSPVASFHQTAWDYGSGDVESFVHINPELKQFDFAKVVHPFDAYQELTMFLGNNMAIQVDPPSRQTDVEKVGSHGFNQFSFRRGKEEDKKFLKRKAKEEQKRAKPEPIPEPKIEPGDDF